MPVIYEPIGGGLAVPVTDHCRFTEDAVRLAAFAAPTPADTVCDLGAGSGILPLLWCRRNPPKAIAAVEREEALVALLRDAVTRFSLETTVSVYHTDWANDAAMPAAHSMTLITCNPPYFPFGASRPCADPLEDAMRREDHPALLDAVCRAAARLLTDNGRFCLCHRPARLADVLTAVDAAGLRPRRLQLVQANETASPSLMLLEAAHTGTLRVLPTVIAHPCGDHTDNYKRLYR